MYEKISRELGYESINSQLSNRVIDEITPLMAGIRRAGIDFNLYEPILYFKTKTTRELIKEIDAIILKRFGIRTKHISSLTPYAILTSPPINDNVLVDVKENYKSYRNHLKDVCKTKTCDPGDLTPVKSINDSERKIDDIIRHMKVSHDSITETMKTSKVKIDLENAKIANLPKDYAVFVLVNFFYLINKLELSPRVLTAILIHEVGHAFTHIEYSYRRVENNSLLIDTLNGSLKLKNDPIKVFELVNRNLLDNSVDKSGNVDKDSITIVTAMGKLFVTQMDKYGTSSASDSERLADQFASRFGLGSELAIGVNKIGKMENTMQNILLFIAFMYSSLVAVIVMGSILGLGISVTILIVMQLTQVLIKTISVMAGGDDLSSRSTYDNISTRVEKLLYDQIRQLRTSDLKKEEIKHLLKGIESLQETLKDLPNESVGTQFGGILLKFFGLHKDSRIATELEDQIERLTENKLHVTNKILEIR